MHVVGSKSLAIIMKQFQLISFYLLVVLILSSGCFSENNNDFEIAFDIVPGEVFVRLADGFDRVDLEKITDDFDETSERLQLLRAHWYHQDGTDWVRPVPQQGSFSIASIAQANSLIHMPENSQPLRSGQSVRVRPLAHQIGRAHV